MYIQWHNNPENTNALLKNYPRILKVIQLNQVINFDKVHSTIFDEKSRTARRKERNELIYLIISKLKIGRRTKFNLRKKISNL